MDQQWADPLYEDKRRLFAEIKNTNQDPDRREEPEWKASSRIAINYGDTTDKMTIKERRESLPIYGVYILVEEGRWSR